MSFEAATYVFDDPMRLEQEDVFAQGEYRSIVVGQVDDVLLTVVYASPEEGLYRIISARLVTAHERKAYQIGTVEPGKTANLLLLRADPLQSVEAYDTIELVFLHGRPIPRAVLSARKASSVDGRN